MVGSVQSGLRSTFSYVVRKPAGENITSGQVVVGSCHSVRFFPTDFFLEPTYVDSEIKMIKMCVTERQQDCISCKNNCEG